MSPHSTVESAVSQALAAEGRWCDHEPTPLKRASGSTNGMGFMRTRILLTTIALITSVVWWAPAAEACACTGPAPTSAAFRSAELVFIGTVEQVAVPQARSTKNADGTISGGIGLAPPVATFNVTRVFRGGVDKSAVVKGNGTDCDEPFALQQVWLVYAQQRDGAMTTHKCMRTRLLAEAGEDVKYLEGLQQGKPQAILFGDVFHQIAGPDGQPAQQALFEPLVVVALSSGQRFSVTTDKWGPYQLVLPPGDFEVWVERGGQAVTTRVRIRLENGEDRRLPLSAQFR